MIESPAGIRRASVAPILLGLILQACALLGGCAGFDADVFDERLRRVTVRAYVQTIETQFGGLDDAGLSGAELGARYEERAVQAQTPARFYSVLRELLCALGDPHASLQVSPRFWNGPVAEPEWIRLLRIDEQVWLGAPHASFRSVEGAVRARTDWLAVCGVPTVDSLDNRGLARFLRQSAAFRSRDRRALFGPLRWVCIDEIDGAPVTSTHTGEQLMRGALGSIVTVAGPGADGVRQTFGLTRNSGVFEGEDERGVRRRLDPLALADRLTHGLATSEGKRRTGRASRRRGSRQRGAGRSPSAPARAVQRARGALAARGLELILEREAQNEKPEGGQSTAEPEIVCMRLRTRSGREVGYLRIAEFRASDTGEAAASEERAFHRALEQVFDGLENLDTWVIDLTGNPGGSWRHAGLLMSYFLPETETRIPHVVRATESRRALFGLLSSAGPRTTRLTRAPVEFAGAGKRLFVLVDQQTASAGEIVASMLRGRLGATLVGERTAGAEYSTAEFVAPDGSTLRIGLGGGMEPPLESFQGTGLNPDLAVPLRGATGPFDPEAAQAAYRYTALEAALSEIDATAPDR